MYDEEVRHTNSHQNLASPSASTLTQPGIHAGIRAVGLGKRFGDLWALRGLDLDVAPGTVLGLLGHNGAGKTTAIRMLTTLSIPTEGQAWVAGFDVATHPDQVRRRIGVASQQATVDPYLSGRLNLELIGRLNQLPRKVARARADELLERLELTESAGKLVKSYSGGMRRRIDLAACVVAKPSVLVLDEPTTGLDPRSREDLWQMLRDLVADGTTLLLTTQYLEEADRLADHIVLLDHGRTVASGSPAQLKTQIGGDRIEVTVTEPGDLVAAAGLVAQFSSDEPTVDAAAQTVTAPVEADVRIVEVVRALDESGIDIRDINRRQATLDDVFLSLTGPGAESTTRIQEPAQETS